MVECVQVQNMEFFSIFVIVGLQYSRHCPWPWSTKMNKLWPLPSRGLQSRSSEFAILFFKIFIYLFLSLLIYVEGERQYKPGRARER